MVIPITLGFDVSEDEFSCQIREGKNATSTLIATWDVSFATDGKDGELIATLDDSITSGIAQTIGYMDLKRVSGGEPLNVFDEPLEVLIADSITA